MNICGQLPPLCWCLKWGARFSAAWGNITVTHILFLVSTLPPSLLGIKEEISLKALLSFYNLHCRARNWPKAKDR
jgi:hypothetical protein